jgi:Polysaccharide deacetylase
MSPRSEPGPDRVEQPGDGGRTGPARRTVLLSAAGVTLLAGQAWLPDPSRTRSPSLAGESAVPTTALSAARLSAPRVRPARSVAHPATVRDRRVGQAVAADGHQLANHTWSHAWLPDLSHRAMVREIERAQLTLDRVTQGSAPTVFRVPFGAWSPAILELCWRNRMRALEWSIDLKDRARPPARQIVSSVLSNAAPGRIILDHDGGGDRSHTVAAIRTYLPRLLQLGYRFVLP